MLAVNAWDEPKADVRRYARNNRLAHRILLNGSRIATRYGAVALPTSFLINKKGIIVHRLDGFGESDVRRMERWIEEML